jgi:hypothetical protein
MIEFESDPWLGLNSFDFDNGLAQYMDAADTTQPEVDQETLEERRRTWWLLYIQDRHLALCYNRQNALLDAECEDLLLPLDEASWQSGNFSSLTQRPQFPSFECTGHNIYGWFLPLMTIVGTILDYNHLKNHHTLGKLYTDGQRVQSQVLLQLDNYAQSLVRFEQQASAMDYQDIHHTKTVVAYANLVIQVSRVLLAGKWDPMSLFDDRDLFMATPSFTTTIANAIAAADNVSHILDVDPDLGFVPYFLGIQLLQGSLPLLLIVDRLQTETDPKIINACEVIIRATEACVSTLDTEYQVSLLIFYFADAILTCFLPTAQLPPDSPLRSHTSTRPLRTTERNTIPTTHRPRTIPLDEERHRHCAAIERKNKGRGHTSCADTKDHDILGAFWKPYGYG